MVRFNLEGFSRRYYLLFGLAWMGFIFMMSARPSVPVPPLFDGQDKFMHVGVYAVLGFLWARAWLPQGKPFLWRHVAGVTLLCAIYGATDEFHQMYVPGRDVSLMDWMADGVGGLLGAIVHRQRSLMVKQS